MSEGNICDNFGVECKQLEEARKDGYNKGVTDRLGLEDAQMQRIDELKEKQKELEKKLSDVELAIKEARQEGKREVEEWVDEHWFEAPLVDAMGIHKDALGGAIKRLGGLWNKGFIMKNPSDRRALQVAIEALERIREWRERTDNTKVLMIWRSELHKPLPSEEE